MKKFTTIIIFMFTLVLTIGFMGCSDDGEDETGGGCAPNPGGIVLNLQNDHTASVFVNSTEVGGTNVFSLFPPVPMPAEVASGQGMSCLPLPMGTFNSEWDYTNDATGDYTSTFCLPEEHEYTVAFQGGGVIEVTDNDTGAPITAGACAP